MENTLELVKYLMDELVKVKVANQRWIDKDEIRSYKWEQDRQRIKELEKINDELPCPERMKALEIRNKDLREGIQSLYNERRSNNARIKELEGLEIFHTNKIFDVSTTPEMVSKDVAITYQKELVRAEKLINELEERVGRIDELTNEVYEAPDYPTKFTLNNVVYFEDSRGCFMIANDGATDFTVTITHQEYIDSLNQYLKQEDPRDYPEEPSE